MTKLDRLSFARNYKEYSEYFSLLNAKPIILPFFTGASHPSEMLRGDHLDRLPGLSHPWSALVPQPVLVFPAHVQLLLLRRESSRLLWRRH